MACSCDNGVPMLRSTGLARQRGGRRVWLDFTYVSMAASDVRIMPADLWLPCAEIDGAFVLVEFSGTGGANLTVYLQTAPVMTTDDDGWLNCDNESMSTERKVLDASEARSVPPMGCLRIAMEAAGNVSGTVRVLVLLKD